MMALNGPNGTTATVWIGALMLKVLTEDVCLNVGVGCRVHVVETIGISEAGGRHDLVLLLLITDC